MSAWSACGQPRCCADALLPLDRRGGCPATGAARSGRASPPARRRRTGGRRPARARRSATGRPRRRSGSPWSPARGGRRARRPRASGPGPKSRRWPARSSTPPRYSTTTPSIRRSSPQTFSTSSASCRPSTKIRLARATRARAPWTATEPDAVRVGFAGAACRTGAPQDHRPALEQEPRPEREVRRRPRRSSRVSVSQVAVDRDDLAAPVGRDLLDHRPELGRRPRRRGRAWARASRWRARRMP